MLSLLGTEEANLLHFCKLCAELCSSGSTSETPTRSRLFILGASGALKNLKQLWVSHVRSCLCWQPPEQPHTSQECSRFKTQVSPTAQMSQVREVTSLAQDHVVSDRHLTQSPRVPLSGTSGHRPPQLCSSWPCDFGGPAAILLHETE